MLHSRNQDHMVWYKKGSLLNLTVINVHLVYRYISQNIEPFFKYYFNMDN